MMHAEDVGSIPVVEQNKLVGIVTDRDLAICIVAQGLPPTTPVSAVMTGQPHSIGPDTTIHRAGQLMQVHQIRRLPVCDENGILVGMIALATSLPTRNPNA
jgi:CBS domain-containing protein